MNGMIAGLGVLVFGQELIIIGGTADQRNQFFMQRDQEAAYRARAIIEMEARDRDWAEAEKLGITLEMLRLQRREYRLTTRTTVTGKLDPTTVVVRTDGLLIIPNAEELKAAKDISGYRPVRVVPINQIWKHQDNPKSQGYEEVVLRLLPNGSTNGHIFTRIKDYRFVFDGWVELDGKKLRSMKFSSVQSKGGAK